MIAYQGYDTSTQHGGQMLGGGIKGTKLYANSHPEEMIGGPGTKGKDAGQLAEDKEKRRHLYIRAIMPSGLPTVVADA